MMNPYISWALVLVVAGGLGWYYNGPVPKTKSPIKPATEKIEAAVNVKKPKRKTKKSPEPSPAPAYQEEKSVYEPQVDEADEEIDQKEMAKRFTAVKNGVTPGGGSKSQKKSKKAAASTRAEKGDNRSVSRTSSTGADADDDLSSAGSPMVNAATSSADYVSDMLEAPAPGASVLRVTGSMDSDSQKKKKTQSFKQVETKKQRQQRLKNEARKQQVQEAEGERRKLLEKQLHSAREAERQAAASSKPSAPQTNAWQTKSAANGANGTNGTNGVSSAPKPARPASLDLLDTFEPGAPSAQPAKQWSQGIPTEEEQMRLLGAGDDQWTTVPSKKVKKKGGKTDESEASATESLPPSSAPTPAPVEPKVKVTPTYLPDALRSGQKGHPLDSDWAA